MFILESITLIIKALPITFIAIFQCIKQQLKIEPTQFKNYDFYLRQKTTLMTMI